MRIRLVGVKLFRPDKETDEHTDRRTDMTNLIAAFSNFSNSSKTVLCEISCVLRVLFEVSVILVRCSVTFQHNVCSQQ